MRTSKLADQYTEADLAKYFVAKATELKLVDKFASTTPLVRAYRNLLRAFDNNRYLLVMVTDYLLQGPYANQVGANERLLTIPVFDVALRQLGGSQQPWKFMYLVRFAENQKEYDFFMGYLGLIEDAQRALPGDLPPPGSTWEGQITLALNKLEGTARVLKKRLADRGGLTEVFFTPPVPDHPESLLDLFSNNTTTIMTRGNDGPNS